MSVEIAGAPALTDQAPAKRAVGRAMGRGLRGRCPSCGEGRLFARYLKVEPACAVCGAELHHHRADDAPAYMTIFVVGHLILPPLMWLELRHQPDLWVHFLLWLPLTGVLSLALLPRLKGALIGLQWALRMHGFETAGRTA